jgi:thiol:disulfide interchange protein DsbD
MQAAARARFAAAVARVALGLAVAAGAALAQAPEVRLTAIPEYTAVAAGATVRVAVRMELPTGWHIYWTNPGESGLATTLTWRTPLDLSAGTAVWPAPEPVENASTISHILVGTVYVVTPFSVSPTARLRRAELTADLTWALCAATCLRQQGSVRTVVRVDRRAAAPGPVGPRDPAWVGVEAASATLPLTAEGVALRATRSADGVRLQITGLSGVPPEGSLVTWFPLAEGQTALKVPIRVAGDAVSVTVRPRDVTGPPPGRLTGVLLGLMVRSGATASRALAVDVPVTLPGP